MPPKIQEIFFPWGCSSKCPPKPPHEIGEIFFPWGCSSKCPPKPPPEIEEIFLSWDCSSKWWAGSLPAARIASLRRLLRMLGAPGKRPPHRIRGALRRFAGAGRVCGAGHALRCAAAPAACRLPAAPSAMRRHSAIFPCFFLSVTTVLFSSPAKASTSLARVSSGRITSSTKPQDAAKYGLRYFSL